MSILKFLRRGHDRATEPNAYPRRYEATMRLKIDGMTVMKHTITVSAKNRDHAAELAKIWSAQHCSPEWTIKAHKNR
jgi:hypothetical protein